MMAISFVPLERAARENNNIANIVLLIMCLLCAKRTRHKLILKIA